MIRTLAKALDGALPIIGVGGILSGADAQEKIDAGATLVQIYTGLIYRGPDSSPNAHGRSLHTDPTDARRVAAHAAASHAKIVRRWVGLGRRFAIARSPSALRAWFGLRSPR